MIGAILIKKAVAEGFDALNKHDLSKFMSAWRDDGTFIYPGEVPESGTYNGKKAVENWFQNFLNQFPKIQFDVHDICVRNIFALTGNNVVAVHWTIQVTNQEGRTGQNTGVTLIHVIDSKVFKAKDYIFDLGEDFKRNWDVV